MSVGSLSFVVIWPLLSIFSFSITLFVNYSSSTGLITNESFGDVARKYELMITPSDWAFAIWAFIYTWQGLWMLYTLYLSFKHDMHSIVLGRLFYISFIISNIFNALTVIAWCYECIIVAGISLLLATIALILCFVVSSHYIMVQEIPYWLSDQVQCVLIALVLNGIAMYTQWLVIASCLDLGVILCFKAGVANETASFVSLGVLCPFLFVYWILDLSRNMRYVLRFTYTPYIVAIIAFCGMITKHGIDA
eukprot:343062_1